MSKREKQAWAKHLRELANRREERERIHRLRMKTIDRIQALTVEPNTGSVIDVYA